MEAQDQVSRRVSQVEANLLLTAPGKEMPNVVYGINHDKLSKEHIIISNGSGHALSLAFSAFVDPGDAILSEAPTFSGTLATIRRHGARVLDVPLREVSGICLRRSRNGRQRRNSHTKAAARGRAAGRDRGGRRRRKAGHRDGRR